MTSRQKTITKMNSSRAFKYVSDYVDHLWSIPGRFFQTLGDMLLLLGRAAMWSVRPPFRVGLTLQAMEFVGVGSLGIIVLVAFFSGAVIGLQSVEGFRRFQADGYVGSAVSLTMTRELAPVFTALMVTGRAGSAMATELGSMRITEQIDALYTMAVNPIQYLVVPRLIASTIMMPILTMVFVAVSMMGAYLFAVSAMGVDPGVFISNVRWFTDPEDLAMGLIKAIVFGLLMALVGCYQGFNASGGAKGVGLATTRSVVITSVMILVLDFLLTDILLTIFF